MSGRGVRETGRPSSACADGGPVADGVDPHGHPGGRPRASSDHPVGRPKHDDRRSTERIEVLWSVDCETEETFLYAAITNISEMGIFVRTTEPLAVGTSMTLRFAPPGEREPFILNGVVQWVNKVRPLEENLNPGMGIRFVHLTLADRERIVGSIRTIAYLREEPQSHGEPRDSSN